MKNEDYIKSIDKEAERRFFAGSVDFEERDGQKDSNVIEGYAAVFNKDSEDFGGWVERIAPGAFDDVLNDDAFALINHESNLVLGRNGVNVKLTQDKVGLKYRIELPDTTVANDLRILVKSGIINKSSFAFTANEVEWKYAEDRAMPDIRTVKKMKRLYDVSPVTYPAYPDTSIAARSYQRPEPQPDNSADLDLMRMEQDKLSIENI
jgi:HK97 family phage prohead protease